MNKKYYEILPLLSEKEFKECGMFNISRIHKFIKDNDVNQFNYKEFWNIYEIIFYNDLNNENDKIFYFSIFNDLEYLINLN